MVKSMKAYRDAIVDGVCDERDALRIRVSKLEAALKEAILQIEYLHDKFTPTGSGNGVLAKLRAALEDTP